MKVGFIGTGNMGGALAHAAAQSPAPAELLLSNRTPEKALGLAGESHDQVCGEGTAREALPEEGHTLHITGGVILPAHPDKDGVAAGLETQVELGAQVGEAG